MRLTIQKKIEIHFGGSDYSRHFGLAVLWGYTADSKDLMWPGQVFAWKHHLFITIDPEDYHNFGRACRRLLPRVTHG